MNAAVFISHLASPFWIYSALIFVTWARHLVRTEFGQRVPMVTELVTNLVPIMIALIALVAVGAFFGLASVASYLGLALPVGLVFALSISLQDISLPSWPSDGLRLICVAAIFAVLIWQSSGS